MANNKHLLVIYLSVLVIRESNVMQLDVDSEVNHVVGPLTSHSFDTKELVFVGGVPGSNSA